MHNSRNAAVMNTPAHFLVWHVKMSAVKRSWKFEPTLVKTTYFVHRCNHESVTFAVYKADDFGQEKVWPGRKRWCFSFYFNKCIFCREDDFARQCLGFHEEEERYVLGSVKLEIIVIMVGLRIVINGVVCQFRYMRKPCLFGVFLPLKTGTCLRNVHFYIFLECHQWRSLLALMKMTLAILQTQSKFLTCTLYVKCDVLSVIV